MTISKEAALAALQASPELAAKMSDLVGGPALIETQKEIADLNVVVDYAVSVNKKMYGELAALRKAATEPYRAGRWTTPAMGTEKQAKLWEGLRDALGLEPDGPTSNRPAMTETPKAAA